MAITGGIKFFESNKFLFKNGCNAFALSGSTAHYILNNNRNNKWQSVNSLDGITEGVVVQLDQSYSITRLIFNGHNFKDITAYLLDETSVTGAFSAGEYFRFLVQEASDTSDGSVDSGILQEDGSYIQLEGFTDLSSVASDPGLRHTITDTNITTSTSYYEFDAVQVRYIYFEVSEVQELIANPDLRFLVQENSNTLDETLDNALLQEDGTSYLRLEDYGGENKFLKCLIGTNEIGTLTGYPAINSSFDRNTREFKALSGKSIIQRGVDTAIFDLNFENYPGQADYNILTELYESLSDFHIWLCGGREGTTYFTHTLRGFGIDDLYLVNFRAAFNPNYANSIYYSPYEVQVRLTEVIG